MKQTWFKKAGWLYRPIHPAGVAITGLAIVFIIPVVLSVDRHAHAVADELYTLFVYATCTAFWWKWIAEKTS